MGRELQPGCERRRTGTVVTNSFTPSQTYSTPAGTGTATLIQVALAGDPNGSVSKMFVEQGGWKEGLTVATEDWANGTSGLERKRWTWSAYTQDDTNLSYILNPRSIESKVGDVANIKRTTTEYYPVSAGSPVALYGLVKEVKVYDADQTTVLKRAYTEYNLDAAYVSRRIIGLPSMTELFDQNNALMSKVTYAYDEGGFGDATLNQNISPVQHDDTNYGSGFVIGRGNLTSTTRWDVTAPTNGAYAVTSSVKYNTAGASVAQIDPLGRTVRIGYADNFNDGVSRNALAYPTTLTDPAGTSLGDAAHSSTVQYRFDVGANVQAQSPAPANQTQGKISTREFDAIGRLSKQTVVNSGAYTRYEYPTNGVQTKVYTTIVDTNGNGADAVDEALSESWSDGAGRVRRSRTEHPGSTGGYSGTLTEYDILGQVKRSSIPTEIDANWNPAGDDATRGFLWNAKEYDWKGRTTREINTDGTDRLYSYDGCGCAGSQVTTIQGELVPRDDLVQPTNGRRTQKAYEDILGRVYKTEILSWNGSVALTTVQTFNGRDQVTNTRQYSGSTSSQTYQDTTATFDGHGRLKTSHHPEQQNTDGSPAYTTYNYNVDDSVSSVVDARGASTSYTYNSRRLPEQISYSVPQGSTIPVTSPVTFSYDNAGNRNTMTDSMGTTSFTYDELSRLTSESRHFYGGNVGTDLQYAPGGAGIFNITYAYDLAGNLKTITDPYGQSVYYQYNKIGQTDSITGSWFANENHSYLDNTKYRAWGGIKSIEHVNNGVTKTETYLYNNRLLPETYSLVETGSQYPPEMLKHYQYNGDGRLNYIMDDLQSSYLSNFDRSYKYDNFGQLTDARTGAEARGEPTPQDLANRPYSIQNQYDAFGNTTGTMASYWSFPGTDQFLNYVNNRASGYGYDNDGRLTSGEGISYIYDSAGSYVQVKADQQYIQDRWVDGNGQYVREHISEFDGYVYASLPEVKYCVRSSLFDGAVISESKKDGTKDKTYVYGLGKVVGVQYQGSSAQRIHWDYTEPGNATVKGETVGGCCGTYNELDTLNKDVGSIQPDPPPSGRGFNDAWEYPYYGDLSGSFQVCAVDGFQRPCGLANDLLQNGFATPCPDNNCGPQVVSDGHGRRILTLPFYMDPNGTHSYDQTRGQQGPPTLKQSSKEQLKRAKNDRRRRGVEVDDKTEKDYIPFDVAGIQAGIDLVWQNSDCRDLISQLLTAVSSNGNPIEGGGDLTVLFRMLMSQPRGGLARRPPKNGSLKGGSISGRFRDNNATVLIPPLNENSDPHSQLINDVKGVVNEILHLAGRNIYSDRDFAQRVRDNPAWANSNWLDNFYRIPQVYPDNNPTLTPEERELLKTDNRPYSAYWHHVVDNLCLQKVNFSSLP